MLRFVRLKELAFSELTETIMICRLHPFIRLPASFTKRLPVSISSEIDG